MKFNFVIFGHHWDLYEISYSDAKLMENVRYISTPYSFRNQIYKLIYRIHWSPKINRIINLPFKNIWNSGYFKNDFQTTNPIFFIFFYAWTIYENEGLVNYLRKKYPNSKMVIFFQDLVDLQENIDIEHIKKEFDLVLSFDQAESKKYNLVYHPLVFSNYPIQTNPTIQDCDIYFLGKAKNRLVEIIKTYEYLRSKNLKCEFYLIGVHPSKQVYPNEIHYIESMSYNENLQHVVSSKCLLEIMQHGGSGYTQRMNEAIAYDKKILTNNREVKNAPFYNKKYISIFSNINNIDISFLNDSSNENVDYNFKEQLSPKELLSFIEKKLN